MRTRKQIAADMARAIYESHQLKRPWEHPKTVATWHRACFAAAEAAFVIIAAEANREHAE